MHYKELAVIIRHCPFDTDPFDFDNMDISLSRFATIYILRFGTITSIKNTWTIEMLISVLFLCFIEGIEVNEVQL